MSQQCFICRSPEGTTFNTQPDGGDDALVCDCSRCGRYWIDRAYATFGGSAALKDGQRLHLSAAVRAATDRNRRLERKIDESSYLAIATTVTAPHAGLDQLDML